MASFSSIPTDIWTKICEQLCLHCHMPKNANGIPDVRFTEAREGKAALKSLCFVSRDICAISQPVLFHYFLNVPDGGQSRWRDDDGMINQVPGFLRALVLRPSLGRHVRMLCLFHLDYQEFDDITRRDLVEWSRVSARYHIQVPIQVTRALAGRIYRGRDQPLDDRGRLFFKGAGASAQVGNAEMYEYSLLEVVWRWLYVLTLNHVPHITHLQLTRPLDSLQGPQITLPVFPQVCELTYDGYNGLEDIVQSHALFPNLSSLGARHLLGIGQAQLKGGFPAMNLRRLSIQCTPKALIPILQHCTQLLDLECHVLPWREHLEPITLQWPAHTTSTLRRLAWSNGEAVENVMNIHDLGTVCIVPLRDFSRLEVLQIDQSSILLYSKFLNLLAKNLSPLLPKALRILHIAFGRLVLSPTEIGRQLRNVASAKNTDLPKLSIVQIDAPRPRRSKKETLEDYMERTGVISIMANVGVDLRIGQEVRPINLKKTSNLSPTPGAGFGGGDDETVFQPNVFFLSDV